MKLVSLQRAWDDDRVTLGMLKIYDEGYEVEHDPIFTLENPLRQTTKDNRIPSGRYECVPYNGTKYKDVYLVQNVPGRSAILFHWGNWEEDTEGCIILGSKAGMLKSRPAVMNSMNCFKKFRELIGREKFILEIKEIRP